MLWLGVAAYDLLITPWPLELQPNKENEVFVSLMMAPPPNSIVTVTIDSAAAGNMFVLSRCRLTFNSSNWAVAQSVFILPTGYGLQQSRKVRATPCRLRALLLD